MGTIGLVRGADATVRNSFVLNEANAVSGDKFLESNKFDSTLGRLQRNGQNWLEFIVVQGPLGETATGVTALSPFTGQPTGANWSVNSQGIIRLEGFAANANPTQQKYLDLWLNDYQDGSSGSFVAANGWNFAGSLQLEAAVV